MHTLFSTIPKIFSWFDNRSAAHNTLQNKSRRHEIASRYEAFAPPKNGSELMASGSIMIIIGQSIGRQN
jgi:hypothetical protein